MLLKTTNNNETFCDILQNVLDDMNGNDMIIILGDLSAQVCKCVILGTEI